MPDRALEQAFAAYVGQSFGPADVARDAVNEPMIRQWCEVTGDQLPVYWDPEAAKNSVHGGLVAPPLMLGAWTMQGWEMRLGYDEPKNEEHRLHKILTEAGYTGAAEGQKLAKDGAEVPNLVFRFGEGDATRTTIAELAQAQLALIGITVDLKAIPDGELGTVLTESDFDLVIFGWSGSPTFVAAPNQYFQTGVNYGNYSFPEVDTAIAVVPRVLASMREAGAAVAADPLGQGMTTEVPA